MFNKKTQSDRPDSEARPITPAPQYREPERAPATAGASTVLAEGSKFVGTTQVSGTFRIEGRCEGEIKADDCIVIGKTGDVEANATSRRAVFNGKFQGKIEASDRVELQSGSRVDADIHAKHMVMEDGVQFRGNCQIGG
jgi:cytoskeletal protein CcmA (bactofilin family)